MTYFLLLLGICCISTSAILVTVSGSAPVQAAFYRNFFAALFWLSLYHWSKPFADPGHIENFEFIKKQWLRALIAKLGHPGLLLLLGLLFAIDLWGWHHAIFLLGAGQATLVGNIQVFFVAFLAVFLFGEQLTFEFWLGIILAILGIALLTLTKGFNGDIFLGLILCFLAAFTYALFLLVIKVLSSYEIPPAQLLFWIALITAFFLFFPTLATDGFTLSSSTSIFWLLGHSLISSVLGWWLIIHAMAKLPITKTSTLLLLQPILTNIWGHLFLEQYLSVLQVLGIILAIIGIRLATWTPKRFGDNKECCHDL